VRGPLPSGPSTFSIRYRIPVTSDVVSFVREFPFEIPLFSLMVADTGLTIETKDLHRRRPIRTQDRKYLHLEAFGVDSGRPVRVSLEPLKLRLPAPQWASAGFAVVAGLLAIGFLTMPLRDASEQQPAPQPGHYAEERESVLASLRSLEDDFDTGKLTEADYQALRTELRAAAVSLLSQERADLAAQTAENDVGIPPVPVCGDCGAELGTDALFCSRCGTKVGGESPSGGTSG